MNDGLMSGGELEAPWTGHLRDVTFPGPVGSLTAVDWTLDEAQ